MDEGKRKVMLAIRVDRHAIDSLDSIAAARDESTAQVMTRFFEGVRESVEVLQGDHYGDPAIVRDALARTLLAQLPRASPQALLFVGSIWIRAAELRAEEGAHNK